MLKCREYPDAVLALPTRPITDINGSTALLAQEMAEVMYDLNGVGLAANQVGITQSLFIYDERVTGNYSVVINPVLTLGAETITAVEGCLSVPNRVSAISRSIRCHLSGLDLDGNELSIDASGFLARIFQHETDHLNGMLILDRIAAPESLHNRFGW
jgi:peptide deformylase